MYEADAVTVTGMNLRERSQGENRELPTLGNFPTPITTTSKPQSRKRKSAVPLVTEETIGEPPTKSLFDHFLGDHK